MTRKRRSFSAQFKFNVALEAVKESKTLSELASEHGVHPNQITRWKQQLIKEGAGIFSRNPNQEQQKSQAVETDLLEQIGRLKMELEWLKKSSLTNTSLLSPLIQRSAFGGNASCSGSIAPCSTTLQRLNPRRIYDS